MPKEEDQAERKCVERLIIMMYEFHPDALPGKAGRIYCQHAVLSVKMNDVRVAFAAIHGWPTLKQDGGLWTIVDKLGIRHVIEKELTYHEYRDEVPMLPPETVVPKPLAG
jgi:hypothetical protein